MRFNLYIGQTNNKTYVVYYISYRKMVPSYNITFNTQHIFTPFDKKFIYFIN